VRAVAEIEFAELIAQYVHGFVLGTKTAVAARVLHVLVITQSTGGHDIPLVLQMLPTMQLMPRRYCAGGYNAKTQ
jgi:hypothetical protein